MSTTAFFDTKVKVNLLALSDNKEIKQPESNFSRSFFAKKKEFV